jgi:hypothetical protein
MDRLDRDSYPGGVSRLFLLLVLAFLAQACRAQHYLQISSTPPGAEVRLDNEAVGTTPVRVPFEHYGTRRLTFHLAGYRTASRQIHVRPRWYSRFPLDILTEVILPLGLTDKRKYHENLVPGEELMSMSSLRSVIERADHLRNAGPEGPRDLPELAPAIVPPDTEPPEQDSAPPQPEPEPRRQ